MLFVSQLKHLSALSPNATMNNDDVNKLTTDTTKLRQLSQRMSNNHTNTSNSTSNVTSATSTTTNNIYTSHYASVSSTPKHTNTGSSKYNSSNVNNKSKALYGERVNDEVAPHYSEHQVFI